MQLKSENMAATSQLRVNGLFKLKKPALWKDLEHTSFTFCQYEIKILLEPSYPQFRDKTLYEIKFYSNPPTLNFIAKF